MKNNKQLMYPSIALIVPYFGKLPNYFPLWLESCRENPTIDWYIFSDDKTEYDYPENVYFTYMTFNEATELFQKKFDFKIKLLDPYKLTDFKPTYGEVFSDYVQDYDFWGFCDVDLIFGNIRKFITKDILNNYDKILANGHFVLLRNNILNNNIFRENINGKMKYKDVYSDKKHRGFDEYGDEAFHSICKESHLKIYINNLIYADINSWKKHFTLTYARRLVLPKELPVLEWEEKDKNHCTIFSFNNGDLIRYFIKNNQIQKHEYMYVHFQKRRMDVQLSQIDNKFLMVPNKFIDHIDKINIDILRKLGKKKFISSRRWKRRIYITIRMFIKNKFGI